MRKPSEAWAMIPAVAGGIVAGQLAMMFLPLWALAVITAAVIVWALTQLVRTEKLIAGATELIEDEISGRDRAD